MYKKKISVFLLLISILLSVISGCGYTLHGKASLPFDSIQIVRIENKTLEPKLQDRLYLALTQEFLKQGISVSPAAAYKLNGTIHSFDLRIVSERSDIASEYEVLMKADFKVTDPSGKTKEFKDITSPFIVSFSVPTGPLEGLIARKEIATDRGIQDIATEIVAALIYSFKE